MSTHEDFVSFEKALRDLQLRSEELKKLVSEGEIRAFRDGESMKFKREDLESLVAARTGEDDLAFADSLEDDTGMVTEELSDEDTLLAEDDFEDDVESVTAAPITARGRSRPVAEEESKEPGWVIALAILTTVILMWGTFIGQGIAGEQSPEDSMFTQMWKKAGN